MLLKRSFEKEIIDDLSIRGESLKRALYELKLINLFLGGNSATRAGISAVGKGSKKKLRILDVGSGSSDIFLNMKPEGRIIELVCADINIYACRYAKMLHPEAKVVCCDVRSLPFKEDSFDIVHASLFFHHFRGEDVTAILNKCITVAKEGIVINDLRRSVLALLGIKILTRMFSKSPLVINDAPLSVKRGFVKKDLKAILSGIRCCSFTIKRKWAFRWLVCCMKNNYRQ